MLAQIESIADAAWAMEIPPQQQPASQAGIPRRPEWLLQFAPVFHSAPPVRASHDPVQHCASAAATKHQPNPLAALCCEQAACQQHPSVHPIHPSSHPSIQPSILPPSPALPCAIFHTSSPSPRLSLAPPLFPVVPQFNRPIRPHFPDDRQTGPAFVHFFAGPFFSQPLQPSICCRCTCTAPSRNPTGLELPRCDPEPPGG